MPVTNADDARLRLLPGREPLTDDEVREILPYVNHTLMGGDSAVRLQAEITYRNIQAVRDFDRSSTRIARWMIALAIAQLIMAAAQIFMAMVLRGM